MCRKVWRSQTLTIGPKPSTNSGYKPLLFLIWYTRDMKLTLFQQKTYQFVKTISKRKTATYKEVAMAIGHPKAYRAVGNALNKNPYIGIVPCHRVIRSDGKAGGYVLGTKKKLELLLGEKIKFESR